MKLLLVKSLLAASIMAYGASAINFCSSGQIQTNTRVDPATPGSTDYIQDCNIAERVEVTYTNYGAPKSRTSAMELRVINSVFGADARMVLLGKDYDASQVNATACNFIIQRNTFGAGAMLYVRGSFAPDSTITISGNSFNFGYPLVTLFPTPPGPTETFASAVYLHDVYLLDNVAIAINDNVIKGNSTNGFVAVNAINFGGDVYFYGPSASVTVNNNDIDIVCNATSSFGTAIGGEKNLYIYAKDAKFAVENNRITSIGSSSVLNHPGIVTVNPGSGSTSFSNNVITANTVGMASVGTDATYRPFIRTGILNIQNLPVNVWIANNTADVTGSLASIGFADDITCGTGCALYVKDNKISATGADPRLHFLGGIDLSGNGALWITGNTLTRVSVSPTTSPLYFGKSLRLNGQSGMAVTGNVFNAQSPTLMAELSATAQSGFIRQSGAALFMCGNSFGGNELATLDDVKAVVSTQLGNGATVDGCPTATTTTAPPTTTVVVGTDSSSVADTTDDVSGNATSTVSGTDSETLTPTSTADPLPNNKGVATSVAAALAAAVMAVAAMLL